MLQRLHHPPVCTVHQDHRWNYVWYICININVSISTLSMFSIATFSNGKLFNSNVFKSNIFNCNDFNCSGFVQCLMCSCTMIDYFSPFLDITLNEILKKSEKGQLWKEKINKLYNGKTLEIWNTLQGNLPCNKDTL